MNNPTYQAMTEAIQRTLEHNGELRAEVERLNAERRDNAISGQATMEEAYAEIERLRAIRVPAKICLHSEVTETPPICPICHDNEVQSLKRKNELLCQTIERRPLAGVSVEDVQIDRDLELWNAINEYAESCGGNTGSGIAISERRIAAVARIGNRLRILAALDAPRGKGMPFYDGTQEDGTRGYTPAPTCETCNGSGVAIGIAGAHTTVAGVGNVPCQDCKGGA